MKRIPESNIDLKQRSANYGPWTKSDPLPVFVNRILLEHSHTFVYVLSIAAFPRQWQS